MVILKFTKTPVLIMEYNTNRSLQLLWNSVTFKVKKNELNNALLLNANKNSSKVYQILMLPFESIAEQNLWGIKKVSKWDQSNILFGYFENKEQSKFNGYAIPLDNLSSAWLHKDEEDLLISSSNQSILKELFKAPLTRLTILKLDDLLEIKKLSLDHYSKIKYYYSNESMQLYKDINKENK